MFICQTVVYPSLRKFYSTYAHEYSYNFSIAYLHGVPSVTIVTILTFLSLMFFLCIVSFNHSNVWIKFNKVKIKSLEAKMSWKVKLLLILIFFIVASFTILANAIYIYISYYSTRSVTTVVQISLSIFNVIMNSYVVPLISDYICRILTLRILTKVSLESAMKIMNIIVAPLISILFSSDNCFAEYITGNEELSLSYSSLQCEYMRLDKNDEPECRKYESIIRYLSFYPSIEYQRYNCRNEVIEHFVPVLLISCALTMAYRPLFYLFLSRWSNPIGSLPPLLFSLSGGIVWPEVAYSEPPFVFLFDVTTVVVDQFLSHAVLLTMGIISPPLLLAVTLTSAIDYLTYMVILKRFLYLCKDESTVQRLEVLCQDVWRCPFNVKKYIIAVSSVFFFFFSWDMLMDRNLYQVDMPAIVSMFLFYFSFPVFMWYGCKFYFKNGYEKTQSYLNKVSEEMELQIFRISSSRPKEVAVDKDVVTLSGAAVVVVNKSSTNLDCDSNSAVINSSHNPIVMHQIPPLS